MPTYAQVTDAILSALRVATDGQDDCAACQAGRIDMASAALRELVQHPRVPDRPIRAVLRALDDRRPSDDDVRVALEAADE